MASQLPENDWSEARLIPAIGIRGSKEQEQRSTSALLAVILAVPSFGHALLKPLGAPKAAARTYVEPRFQTDDGGTAIPDGLIVVERGKKRWVCLVEVKTGDSELRAEQVDNYLKIANREGYDAVLTVSNQIVGDPSESPVKVDGRRLRNVRLAHLSWFRILTEAIAEHQHRGVEDPDQAWILGELIEFLDDERSGAGGFDGMGQSWVKVRDAARSRTLRITDAGVREVAEGWEAFIEYLSLRLYQSLGSEVTPAHPRGSTRQSRMDASVEALGHSGRLRATLQVPDTAAPLEIEADLGSQQITAYAQVPAPREGRPTTRINWLLRQLREAPGDLRVEVRFLRTRETTALPISVARTNPSALLLPTDKKREPREFEVALTRDMGTKRGKGRGSFVAVAMDQVGVFYGEVLENLRRWTPPPPRLPRPTSLSEGDEVPVLGVDEYGLPEASRLTEAPVRIPRS